MVLHLEQFPIKRTGSASVSFGAATCQLHAMYMLVKTALVVSAGLLSQTHPARRCRGQCCSRWPRCVAWAYWMALLITPTRSLWRGGPRRGWSAFAPLTLLHAWAAAESGLR